MMQINRIRPIPPPPIAGPPKQKTAAEHKEENEDQKQRVHMMSLAFLDEPLYGVFS
jgi:hypothetical protein